MLCCVGAHVQPSVLSLDLLLLSCVCSVGTALGSAGAAPACAGSTRLGAGELTETRCPSARSCGSQPMATEAGGISAQPLLPPAPPGALPRAPCKGCGTSSCCLPSLGVRGDDSQGTLEQGSAGVPAVPVARAPLDPSHGPGERPQREAAQPDSTELTS